VSCIQSCAPSQVAMVCYRVNPQTELRSFEMAQASEMFAVLEANREHLRRWHAWVDLLRSPADVEKAIAMWKMVEADRRGLFFGIWFKGRLCGMINHQSIDYTHGWSALSYWLTEADQGIGLMSTCCRALINHAFEKLKLHRITIECATENRRSRAIPERLGFQLEGIARGIEFLHGRHIDHALYGLLRPDWIARRESEDAEVCRAEGAGEIGWEVCATK